MDSATARNGDVEIAYEVFGTSEGSPLLLVSGMDGQMIGWPDGFCLALAAAGYQVVRYDHRDAGLSTHFTGRKRAYEVTDMLDDMLAVQDSMGWTSAHLVGLSMGGGLAQFAALLRPERVKTLTLIGAAPQYGNQLRLFRHIRFPGPFKMAFHRYGKSRDEQKRMLMDITRFSGGKSLPLEEDWIEEIAEECLRRRRPDPHSRARQLAASRAAKMPKGGIGQITQPVLAIHGDEDPIVRPSAGRAIARTVQDGTFVLVHRMGHLFSPPLWPELVDRITRHAR
ncbi:alpha/beta fold hydrolase [Actinomadura sp. 9N407]|uniref:alpha/beta fold hydrolase n=1 Tax=Actinomadura sp. 9N407 TaxID=3375154 RepID=UPI0037BD3BC8